MRNKRCLVNKSATTIPVRLLETSILRQYNNTFRCDFSAASRSRLRGHSEPCWTGIENHVVHGEQLLIRPAGTDLHLMAGIRMEPKRRTPAVHQLAIFHRPMLLGKHTGFLTWKLGARQRSRNVGIFTDGLSARGSGKGINEFSHDLQITICPMVCGVKAVRARLELHVHSRRRKGRAIWRHRR